MATDLTLYLDDEPGELALIGDVLGKAGVNIVGLCALTSGGGLAEVHILVQDATSAFEALEGAGIKIAEEQEVIVLDIKDRPGENQFGNRLSRYQHPFGAWRGQPRRRQGRAGLSSICGAP
jgi:hypothetical protein